MQTISSTENSVHVTDQMSVEDAIRVAVQRVNNATVAFQPVYMSAGLSGGNDSLAATYIASLSRGFKSAFHIDTGVGLRATEEFVVEVAGKMGWPLEVYAALENKRADGTPDPQDYFKLVKERGFPGPAHHFKMYQRLKQRQIERWCRAHKKWRSREVLMLVSGRRSQESARRGRTVVGDVEGEGRIVWANPLHDFSKLDCRRILDHAGIPESPVYKFIHKSGECLCGAFGSPEELQETKLFFPDDPTVVRLVAADKEERETRGWGWGQRPVKACKIKGSGPMCSKCDMVYAEQQALGLRPHADTNPGL